ncbi:hypothetical protein [Amycolatopsis sp.]|uniref:hypothetical protein n=1 Tax=Amycolatopsis sp. TaxID=37632 RepID=UPI002BE05A72|nr:hypothetical protein [Amycolatopsis sp.]HVV11757.1 hypothetical protein [Amycolatopsis sp.]
MADAGEDWALTKAKLTHDPHEMEGYGNNIATMGKNFQSDINGPVQMIRGGGDDTQVSTGHFPEGAQVQSLISRNASEMTQFLQAAYQSVVALSSVALIYADLMRNTDLSGKNAFNAIEWAFAIPGADKPKGLPSYVENKTLAGEMKPGPTDTAGEKVLATYQIGGSWFTTYSLAGGGTRSVVQGPDGKTETFYDKNGNKISEAVTVGNHTTTTTFDTKTGKRTGQSLKITEGGTMGGVTSTYTVDLKTHAKTLTSQRVASQSAPESTSKDDVYNSTQTVNYNAKGKVESTTTEHVDSVYNSDGTYTRKYYTVTEADGKTTTSDVREITRQPQPVTQDEIQKVTQDTIDRTTKQVKGH